MADKAIFFDRVVFMYFNLFCYRYSVPLWSLA